MSTLYIVFTATSYKTGSFIRMMTRGQYNHVSIAFDPDLDEVYSFGRLWLHTPFCGGFVREGGERFILGGKRASVSVCAVHVDDAHMRAVRARVNSMLRSGPYHYIYNMASAALVPMRVRAHIRDCYTCIEFAVSILLIAGYPIRDKFYSITELHRILSPNEIYCGEYPGCAPGESSTYFVRIPPLTGITVTTRQLWRMTRRIARK